ncbi:hypothetical protein F5Y11DRAFT_362165 [Daldinia sp. FL1419]|nr:hypothetical protein F5Y11DRAFT_362165 [Daldinia sp. FL1419]
MGQRGEEIWENGKVQPPYAVVEERVTEETVSSDLVVGVVNRYKDLLQNPVIRPNYFIAKTKSVKPTSALRSPFYGATLGELWAHRKASAVPEDPIWFDGTLIEGFLEVSNTTVSYQLPDMLSVRPGWYYENLTRDDADLPVQFAALLFLTTGHNYPREEVDGWIPGYINNRRIMVRYLHVKSAQAADHLRIANEAQGPLQQAIESIIDTVVAEGRELASGLDTKDATYEDLIRKPESPDWTGVSNVMEMNPILRFIYKVRWNIFSDEKRDEENRDFKDNVRITMSKVLVDGFEDFLTSGRTTRNAMAAIYSIDQTYEALNLAAKTSREEIEPYILEISREIKRDYGLRRSKGGWPRNALLEAGMVELDKNANKTSQIRRSMEIVAHSAKNLTQELASIDEYRRAEAEKATSRTKAMLWGKHDGVGQSVMLEKRKDEITGQEQTVHRVVKFVMARPSTMATRIREAIDGLEYTWREIKFCENDLAYMNICEVTGLNLDRKEELLRNEFQKREGSLGREIPTCDEVGNPIRLRNQCKDNYLDG